jgi:hypothetical protein
MIPRVVFDTGALIALERNQQSILRVHRQAVEGGYAIAVVTPVIAEWWRKGKREKERTKFLRTLSVEAPGTQIAQLAGEAIGLVGAGVVDALVMAAASLRGDTVYTSDFDDLNRLRRVFPNVVLARV